MSSLVVPNPFTGFDRITATKARRDGLAYCANFPLPPAESDLMQKPGQNPAGQPVVFLGDGVPSVFGSGVSASVFFNVTSAAPNAPAWVVLQGSDGDQRWFDLSGCVFNGPFAAGQTALFVLPAGPYGTPTVLQQTRKLGQAPAASFFNPFPMPGNFRFLGQGPGSGSGSSGPGITVSIFYRPVPPR